MNKLGLKAEFTVCVCSTSSFHCVFLFSKSIDLQSVSYSLVVS